MQYRGLSGVACMERDRVVTSAPFGISSHSVLLFKDLQFRFRGGSGPDEKFQRVQMSFQHFAAAWRALTSPKDGPSLYDLCDPVLLHPGQGDPHLAKFYRTALA